LLEGEDRAWTACAAGHETAVPMDGKKGERGARSCALAKRREKGFASFIIEEGNFHKKKKAALDA